MYTEETERLTQVLADLKWWRKHYTAAYETEIRNKNYGYAFQCSSLASAYEHCYGLLAQALDKIQEDAE
jgi:hypothetical protein